jgi:hypothetical protein
MEIDYPHLSRRRSCWSLTLGKIIFLAALPGSLFAQFNETESHTPKGEGGSGYLFPINPGQTNYLAGTMGELRNTHFHGGIDIRTDNQIGVPVLATQDGYISRAQISSFSYGTVLYLSHPDGRTSVYGHLDKFKGKIRDFLKQEQYNRKSYEVDVNFKPGTFSVKKGDTIAFSGNTGSSSGPHLHFEIREGNFALNPLKFVSAEITDRIAPTPYKIALRTLDINARINDRFGRFEFSLIKKSPTAYTFPVPILAHGLIGIELLANDRMDDSPARCGINYIEMFADSQKVFSQSIERVDLEETRSILALMDYKTLETKGKRFNKLYVDDGNRLEFYQTIDEGVISVTQDRSIRILLKDEFGNSSAATFKLKFIPLSSEMVLPAKRPVELESEVMENLLMVTSKACETTDKLTIYGQGKKSEMTYSYKGANQRIYLIDLRKFQPDSVSTCGGSLVYHFKDVIPSATEYTYYSDWADVNFPENSLYDTLFLNVSHQVDDNQETFKIGQRTIPLHKNLGITLKPTRYLTPSNNLAVYRKEGNRYGYLGGEWSNGKVRFASREMGEFTFLTDSLAPTITRIRLDRQSARFRIRDGLSGIAYYEANINGQWLLMAYDFKSGILQSDRLHPELPLAGDFELKVVDRAGNERIFKQKIQ